MCLWRSQIDLRLQARFGCKNHYLQRYNKSVCVKTIKRMRGDKNDLDLDT